MTASPLGVTVVASREQRPAHHRCRTGRRVTGTRRLQPRPLPVRTRCDRVSRQPRGRGPHPPQRFVRWPPGPWLRSGRPAGRDVPLRPPVPKPLDIVRLRRRRWRPARRLCRRSRRRPPVSATTGHFRADSRDDRARWSQDPEERRTVQPLLAWIVRVWVEAKGRLVR